MLSISMHQRHNGVQQSIPTLLGSQGRQLVGRRLGEKGRRGRANRKGGGGIKTLKNLLAKVGGWAKKESTSACQPPTAALGWTSRQKPRHDAFSDGQVWTANAGKRAS